MLLARLKTSMRSRAVELWRQVYAHHNPLAQFFWVRFGKALKETQALVEERGVVRLAGGPKRPGRAELVEVHGLKAPDAPVARTQRQRLEPGADEDYLRWMVDCLTAAGGGLKRRTLAELLARRHGHAPHYPGSGGPPELVDAIEEQSSPPGGTRRGNLTRAPLRGAEGLARGRGETEHGAEQPLLAGSTARRVSR